MFPACDVASSVTHLAARHIPDTTDTEIISTLARFNLTRDGFFLAIGTVEPRKDYLTMLEAYKNLPLEVKQLYPLVIIGGSGWCQEHVITELAASYPNGVRYIGYATKGELAVFLKTAKFLLNSSVYEGFGLPLIELNESACR